MQRNDWGFLAIVGVVGGCVALAAIRSSGGFAMPADGGGWVYQYQTLIGGVLALAGAALTVWKINDQIRQSRRDAERLRRATISGQNQQVLVRLNQMREDLNLFDKSFAQIRDFADSKSRPELGSITNTDLDISQILSLSEDRVALRHALESFMAARIQGKVTPSHRADVKAASERVRQALLRLTVLLNGGYAISEIWVRSMEELQDMAAAAAGDAKRNS